ncbi:alpha/beta hydrolase [Parvularcula maris]|uniref:Alpha/beta fold hydrolase n=1 Tax=Parvularcula maris TaxID=2965077 RepID=A0A9X2RLC3_9PROT|nr:alpha/beta fold hydrolase [Parvularcula maris]MCQ8186407.1 alpha/beta fold hydrolase [Parvularcula maris]
MRLLLTALLLAACAENPAPEPPREPTGEEIARARAFLAEGQSALPGGWTFRTIPFGEDGFLRLGSASPESPRGSVLFVPGYTSSPELASDFLARWYALGFEVASVDLPGQGGSVRRQDDYQKTYTGDFSVFGAAVGTAVEAFDRARMSSGPLILAGDSFGGHSLLRAAADGDAEEADALFPIVPAVLPTTGKVPLGLAEFATGLAVRFGQGAEYMADNGPWVPDRFDPATFEPVCGDREDRAFKNDALMTLDPALRVGGVSNEWAYGMVRSGRDLLRSEALGQDARPIRMVLAGKEVVVRNDAAEKLCARAGENCEVTVVEEATHCVYLEEDEVQEEVHQALLRLYEELVR